MLYRLPPLTPYLLWRGIVTKGSVDINSNEHLYGYARSALEDAYHIIGLNQGDTILYPDYICDVAINPCKNLGLKIEYYPVNNSMEPDWGEVESLIKRGAKAVLTVNYFGFPQNMHRWKERVDKFGVWWIEDNAHGYGGKYEGVELGSWGHVSVASIRKLFPILSGALLRINDPQLHQSLCMIRLTTDRVRKTLCKEEWIRSLGYLLRWLRIPYNRYRAVPRLTSSASIDSWGSRDIDCLSLFILPLLIRNIDQFYNKRRIIYKAWYKFCVENNLKPLFHDLPSGVSPFVFPCYNSSFESRQSWLKWGRKNRVEVYPWPNLPLDVYNKGGEAVDRSRRILCFPIHQDMQLQDISNLRKKKEKGTHVDFPAK